MTMSSLSSIKKKNKKKQQVTIMFSRTGRSALVLLLLTLLSAAVVIVVSEEKTCSANDQSCQAVDDGDDSAAGNVDEMGRRLDPSCTDDNESCELWASQGECDANPNYMLKMCRLSCLVCSGFIFSEQDLRQGLDMGVAQLIENPYVNDETKVVQQIQKARDYLNSKETYNNILPPVKKMCLNEHELCSVWSVMGECESNPKYMKKHCPAACQACLYKTVEGRCPIDPNAPQAWGPGDLNDMFTRLTTEPYLSKYKVNILSSPTSTTLYKGEAAPWVITMDDVLSEEEAETLIQLGAVEGYTRSADVGKIKPDGTHEASVNEGRTSSNAWCQNKCYENEIAKRVVDRLTNITGIPETNSEFLQLLQYQPGQFYQAHHDYIPHHLRRQQGVRILTLYLYLNDVEAGGGTNFDKLNITVMPKRGRALLWPSVFDDDPNKKDDRTTHQALPVEAGIKYGANAWFHMRDFKTALKNRCE